MACSRLVTDLIKDFLIPGCESQIAICVTLSWSMSIINIVDSILPKLRAGLELSENSAILNSETATEVVRGKEKFAQNK